MENLFLLLIFAFMFVCIIAFMILYFRKKDIKLLLVVAAFIIVIGSWGFIFDESTSMETYFTWLICFSLISIVIILGYLYSDKKYRVALLIAIILGCFWLFTFCTEDGSVRLAIALKGYPDIAYSTNLVENTHMRKSNISYYISGKLINTENGTLSFFECRKIGFLKISSYCE